MKVILACVGAVLLAGCAASDKRPTSEIVSNLSVDEKAVASQFPCFHSISPRGAKSASWEKSVCVRTQDKLVFAQRDKDRYVPTASLPFKNVKSVALWKRGLVRQIQLDTEAGVHTVSARSEGLLVDGDGAKTEAEFDALVQAGIPAVSATAWVSNRNSAPLFIPLYVGK